MAFSKEWQALSAASALGGRHAVLEGRLPLLLFGRVVDSADASRCEAGDYEVEARLGFARAGTAERSGAGGWTRLSITASLSVPLRCERCLEAYDHALRIDTEVALVADEASAAVVPDALEYIVCEAHVRPLDLLEEELIMALPLVPAHPDPAQCGELVEALVALAPEFD